MKFNKIEKFDKVIMSLPLWERGLKYHYGKWRTHAGDVAPFVGAWIEIGVRKKCIQRELVAPFVGAWIEICAPPAPAFLQHVAPFVGAWIEICAPPAPAFLQHVAPFVGAWVELLNDSRKLFQNYGKFSFSTNGKITFSKQGNNTREPLVVNPFPHFIPYITNASTNPCLYYHKVN